MISTLVVIILIFNLAVNEGNFVVLINDEHDQLKPGKLSETLFAVLFIRILID